MTVKPITVLLIEDDPAYANLLRNLMAGESNPAFELECTDRLRTAFTRLARGAADVILLDLSLPDSHGLETFVELQAQAPEIPIVVLTVNNDDAIAVEAVRKGAQDYLVKGHEDAKALSRVLRYAMERHRMQSALRTLSLLDGLTGLYNRRGFLTLAEQHLKLAYRTQRGLLIVYADIDNLKQINDTYGHPEGDQALIKTGEILKNAFRTSDIIARIGGDEFAVIAIEAQQDGGKGMIDRFQGMLAEHNTLTDRPFKLSVSVGAAYLHAKESSSIESLMARADDALYKEKRNRKASNK
ncbi:MAG: GGDEF domain-containing response regulator [Candidatus Omnitrophica bacterium]|nr:GGDEF domain-containing response regulator [Candidatus Omnitrophota bacterium]